MATISSAEREAGVQQLESRKEMFLTIVAPLSREQWRFKPAPQRWSIAEITEHLTLAEIASLQRVQESLASQRLTETLEARDLAIQTRVAGRQNLVQSPLTLAPADRWPIEDDLVAAFCGARENTIAFLRATQADLRHHAVEHFRIGPMDCYQWMLFLAAHTERHLAQMKEIQAVSGYPA